LTLGGGGLAVIFVLAMVKEFGKEKQRFNKWRLWREAKENPKNPTDAEKLKKQGNEENAEKSVNARI